MPGQGLALVGMGNVAPCADGELGEIPGVLFEGVGIGIWLVAGFGTGPLVVAGPGVGIGPGLCATFNSNGAGGDEVAFDDAGFDAAAVTGATGVAAETTAIVGEFG